MTAISDKPLAAPQHALRGETPLPPVLRQFWLGISVLTLVAWLVAGLYVHMGKDAQAGLFQPSGELFSDYWHYAHVFLFFHTSQFFSGAQRFAYPAFAAVVYNALYHLGPYRQAIFLMGELALDGVAAALLFKKLRSLGLRLFPSLIFVSSALLFSYPLLVMFERANIEVFTCLLTLTGLWAAVRRRDLLAAGLWGAAGALKIYPLILFALFLSRKKSRFFAWGCAYFAIISVLSMWFVGPTISAAFAGSRSGVGGFVSTYAQAVRMKEVGYDHSLLAPIKIVGFVLAHRAGTLSFLVVPYLLVAGSAALVVFFARAKYLPMTNQLLVLFAFMVLLPPVSYDYTLVHLYGPWSLLVIAAMCSARKGTPLPGLGALMLCFAVLFTPQTYIYYHWIHANGTIKAAALIALIVTALKHPIPDETFCPPPEVD